MISRKFIVFATLFLSLNLSENADAQRSRKRASSTGKSTASSSKKKKSSTARSSSGKTGKNAGKSNKRSASGKSGLRSASGTSGLKSGASQNSKRASAKGLSRNSLRAVKGARSNTNLNTESLSQQESKSTVSNPCPIEALIKKDYDETGNEIYYKTKTQTCNIPENASESLWDFSNSAKAKEFTMKKSWINEDQAISFSCNSGYITSGSKGKYTCSSYDEFCPLNEIIEKVGSSYINPYTGDNCKAPVAATVSKLTNEENSSDIPTGKAFKFDCANNYYTNTDNYIQCMPCPSETPNSIKGSNIGISSCSAGKSAIAVRVSANDDDASSCNDGQWMGFGAKECISLDKYKYTEIANPQMSGTLETGAYKLQLLDNKNTKTVYVVVNKEPKKYAVSLGAKGRDSFIAVNGRIVLEKKGTVSSLIKNDNTFKLYKAISL